MQIKREVHNDSKIRCNATCRSCLVDVRYSLSMSPAVNATAANNAHRMVLTCCDKLHIECIFMGTRVVSIPTTFPASLPDCCCLICFMHQRKWCRYEAACDLATKPKLAECAVAPHIQLAFFSSFSTVVSFIVARTIGTTTGASVTAAAFYTNAINENARKVVLGTTSICTVTRPANPLTWVK